MYITVLCLTKNKSGKELSNATWEHISRNFDNIFFKLDSELKRLCINDFFEILEKLHGQNVGNADNSFSLYPGLLKAATKRQLRHMENVVEWFTKNAKSLYDVENC